jgi:hypothetical protein
MIESGIQKFGGGVIYTDKKKHTLTYTDIQQGDLINLLLNLLIRNNSENIRHNVQHRLKKFLVNACDVSQAESRRAEEIFYILLLNLFATRGSVVVKALCYKSEGRGFETR